MGEESKTVVSQKRETRLITNFNHSLKVGEKIYEIRILFALHECKHQTILAEK